MAPRSHELADVLPWARRAPFVGVWIDALLAIDADALSGADAIEYAAAWERVRRGADASFISALGSIAHRPCRPEPGDPSCGGGSDCIHDWSREDIALALTLGPQNAAGLLDEARELRTRLPGMLGEVRAGRASLAHARKLAGRTLDIADDRLVATVAAHVVPLASNRTAYAFDRLVVATIDRLRTPEEVAAAHKDAARRTTGITPVASMADGMAGAMLTGPAAQIAQLFDWCRQYTRLNRDPDDPRTVGQRRLDALVAGVLDPHGEGLGVVAARTASGASRPGRSSGERGPGSPGPACGGAPDVDVRRARVALKLTLSSDTLLGLSNDPGWLEGHGALPAALARELAVDPASIQRLLVHPTTGELLDLSPTARFPRSALAEFIRARDQTCAAPSCGARATSVDLDHIEEFGKGGKTVRINLHPLCKRHHRARHAGGWRISRSADGTETWTNVYGTSYRTVGTTYLPPPGSVNGLPCDDNVDLPAWSDFDVLEAPPTPSTHRGAAGSRPEDPGDDECPF